MTTIQEEKATRCGDCEGILDENTQECPECGWSEAAVEAEDAKAEETYPPCPECQGTVDPKTVICNNCGFNVSKALEKLMERLFGVVEGISVREDPVPQHVKEYNDLIEAYSKTLEEEEDIPIEVGIELMVPKHQLLIALQLQEIDKTLLGTGRVLVPIMEKANELNEERNKHLADIVKELQKATDESM